MNQPSGTPVNSLSAGYLMRMVIDGTLPAAARLEAARRFFDTLDNLRAGVQQAVNEIATEHRSDPDVLATMYWEFEDVVPTSVLGSYWDIKKIVTERSPWTYPCSDCGAEIPIKSRSELARRKSAATSDAITYPGAESRSAGPVCPKCSWARSASVQEAHRKHVETYRARVQQLKTMPYAEYLQTPEWQERRKVRLRAARYRCQVCNHGNRVLNVHHRTYERRGEEYARDLIVLCQDCHYLFHQNGSLAPHPH